MDVRSIIAPVIHDREALDEFFDVLTDRAPQIERDVAKLKKTPTDRELIADLFRATGVAFRVEGGKVLLR